MTTNHQTLIDEINCFILANLTEKLAVSDLARRFGVSKFHLHRVFFAHIGLGLGQ
ncbi:helix-turn-helix transcriptional regulator [Alteromonas lipolytica]|uniref:helix-turn-helix transcriptional regulator n=1 Tax=Alteromonas lipolytica TaxID=1856405 RepID=UPI0011131C00|nr:helix-turn-helix transcriptional regulator [Alteromonas lipolytica]